jgi:hypothetical protein
MTLANDQDPRLKVQGGTFIVSFGGGLTSYEALRRTIAAHGRENTVSLFADMGQVRDEEGRVVCGEDDDLFRFMEEVERLLDFKITRLKHPDYTDIWDVFFKVRLMGNTQFDPCSERMKRGVIADHLKQHHTAVEIPADFFRPTRPADVLVTGLDWTEPDRVTDYRNAVMPWQSWFPLCEEPLLTKADIAEGLLREGIEPPSLYEQGFSHNNCGGFCVKMGHSQAFRLWKNRPWVYFHHAGKEQQFRQFIGKDVAILRDRRNKETLPLTLLELAARFKAGYVPAKSQNEGCGGRCMTPVPA